MVKEETKETKSRKELNKLKRKNAELYPIYKMFSWDLLCFYSIEFLFYTITKQITPSQVLMISGLYQIFIVVMFIPAVALIDFLGRRKGIIVGNLFEVLYILILIFLPGVWSIIIANLIFSLGYNMKTIAETNLLYDSVSTKGGEGLFSKLDSKGGKYYYIFDGICSLLAGYLFVINNYIPMIVCLSFIIISTLISLKFKDIYQVGAEIERKGMKAILQEYKVDLKQTIKFILKSKRMKSFIIFGAVFTGLIEIIGTCRGDLLTDLQITPEQFSIIFAIITFIGGLSLSLKDKIEKKFKNRTLSFLSLTYIASCLVVGIISVYFQGSYIIPIVLLMYAIQNICTSNWYIFETKYTKNFTSPEKRNKVTFTYEFFGAIIASVLAILGGIVLDYNSASITFLLTGLSFLAIMVVVLDYMRTRFGLKPEEYKKEDIML